MADAERYEKELQDCRDILQELHPIGAVKHIGMLEVSTALKEIADELREHRNANVVPNIPIECDMCGELFAVSQEQITGMCEPCEKEYYSRPHLAGG